LEVSVQFDINRYFIDDIENENHPSIFESFEDYSVFVVRLPSIEDNKIKIYSDAFFIKDYVYIYNRTTKDFEKLGDFKDLYKFIDSKIDKILSKLSKLEISIAAMEDNLYENRLNKAFAKNWLQLKKELAVLERLLEHFISAFDKFKKHYKDQIDQLAFNDLEEHINRAFRHTLSAIKKLDYLYNFYTAKMDAKMNSVIFFLTVISGIFMPLSLLTGFFGMNTGGLPFEKDPTGTIKAVFLFLTFEVPFIILLWQLIRKN
jgi:magnesium transporter